MTATAAAPSLVIGVHCARGHFNDPKVPYCSVCGVSMLQLTRIPAPGRRPPLGVLTLDDGTAYPLGRGYVLGRSPERDELVRSGLAEPLALVDRTVSRMHARVLPSGWDVILIDSGSKNGTQVRLPGADRWSAAPPRRGVPLAPGSRLRIGTRRVRYDSYRNP